MQETKKKMRYEERFEEFVFVFLVHGPCFHQGSRVSSFKIPTIHPSGQLRQALFLVDLAFLWVSQKTSLLPVLFLQTGSQQK